MSDKKLALITGASRGLGAALAVVLAPSHHIMAVAKTTGALEELDDRIQAAGGTATLAPMDLTDSGAVAHLCRSIYDRWGSVSVWAHTAIHAAPLSPADHIDMRDWKKSVEINVNMTAQLIPMVAPLLPNKESTAVFFDDPHVGEKFFGAYAASKTAQIALAKAWAAEQEKAGPNIQIVTPEPMATATRARFFPGENRETLADTRDVAQKICTNLGIL